MKKLNRQRKPQRRENLTVPDIKVHVPSLTTPALNWVETFFAGTTFAPFNFVPLSDFDYIVSWLRDGMISTGTPAEEAMKRQLSLSEAQMMVCLDGEEKFPCGMPDCLNHKSKLVQPVKYAFFSNRLIDEIKKGLSLEKALAPNKTWWRGSYFVDPETARPLLLCGAPLARDPRSGRSYPNRRGCLGLAIEANLRSNSKLRNLPFVLAKERSEIIRARNQTVTAIFTKFRGRDKGLRNSVLDPKREKEKKLRQRN